MLSGPGRSANPPNVLSVLRRIRNRPAADPSVTTCDMCAEPITDDHPHVVDIQSRQLMCTCRGCRLLFTADGAHLRYRAVPDRYLSFPDFALTEAGWDALDIPVGLAFFFASSVTGRMGAFYPGPAGVAESELGLRGWSDVVAANPELDVLAQDVEALLVRGPDGDRPAECFLVPIDACYELAGRLRTVWRGFDGGQDAHRAIAEFFGSVADRAKPQPRPETFDELRSSPVDGPGDGA